MSKRLSREESKEQTRARLMAAGRRMLATQGLASTQIRDVIGEAGLAIGTFYLHFKSKEDLFAAVVEESANELRRRLRAARRDEKTDIARRAENACRAFCEFVVTEKDLFRILFREGLAGTGPESELGRRMIDDSVADLREDLEVGFQMGFLKKRTLDLLAQAIIGMCASVGFALLEEAQPDVEEATQFLSRMIQGGTAAVLTHALSPGSKR